MKSFKVTECQIVPNHTATNITNITLLNSCKSISLVLTIFNERAYLTFESIFHKALYVFQFDCEITLESVPETNQY